MPSGHIPTKTPSECKRFDAVRTASDSEHYGSAERAKRLRVADSLAQSDVSRIAGSVADSDPVSESDCELSPELERHGQNNVASQTQSVPRFSGCS